MIPEHWTFDEPSVARGFDAHVREQLPWYDLVTSAIAQIGRHYIGPGGTVYDIGASTGNIGRALAETIAARDARLIEIEEAPAMAGQWRGVGTLHVGRAQDYSYEPYDFAAAMLALMFIRPDELRSMLDALTENIRPGGALVIVERMLPPNGYPGVITSRLTLAAKRAAGAAPNEIVDKELSLAGAQRPISAHTLRAYDAVEWFRFGDFAGWLIEGPSA